ncbi:hypothetical protein [Deinococcus yavapaiensis]|nr:hypothetical protein [Deinococcus yavapaiensis]
MPWQDDRDDRAARPPRSFAVVEKKLSARVEPEVKMRRLSVLLALVLAGGAETYAQTMVNDKNFVRVTQSPFNQYNIWLSKELGKNDKDGMTIGIGGLKPCRQILDEESPVYASEYRNWMVAVGATKKETPIKNFERLALDFRSKTNGEIYTGNFDKIYGFVSLSDGNKVGGGWFSLAVMANGKTYFGRCIFAK